MVLVDWLSETCFISQVITITIIGIPWKFFGYKHRNKIRELFHLDITTSKLITSVNLLNLPSTPLSLPFMLKMFCYRCLFKLVEINRQYCTLLTTLQIIFRAFPPLTHRHPSTCYLFFMVMHMWNLTRRKGASVMRSAVILHYLSSSKN